MLATSKFELRLGAVENMKRKKRQPREVAVLTGLDASGATVFEESVELHEYWDESHPVIDEDASRRRLGIVRLTGKLYGSTGNLIQEFENLYGSEGDFLSGTARHEDGTVVDSKDRR